MKIILAAAHQVSFSEPVSLRKCLGVLQLAASLKQRNLPCEVEVVDLEEFNGLFTRDFDETMEQVVGKIISPPPDVVGISTMANNLAVVLEICERIKNKLPAVITLLGGPGVSFCAPEVLSQFPQVDAVIRGEADDAFPDYIETLAIKNKKNAVKGLVYRSGEKIVDNGWPEPIENLDQLPIPAYEFCNNNRDENKPGLFDDYNGISIEAGRGCPFNCIFCSTSRFFKRKHRLKSVPRIIDEILYLRNKLGDRDRDRDVIFHHDLLTLRHEYIEELCREIERRIPGLTWKCSARFDTIDARIFEQMRRAGCNAIFLGIEAATPRLQKTIDKHLDLAGFDEKLKLLIDLEYRVDLSFIVGFPGEEPQDIETLLAMVLRAKAMGGDNVVIKMFTLVPLLGSPLYEEWKDRLVYDEYGSFGASDIPAHWKKLKDMIKGHPGIFPIYYHVPIGRERWMDACKYVLLGSLIDALMINSMRLAYSALGKELAAVFVRHGDRIELPPPATSRDIEYPLLMESVRRLVLEFLEPYPVLAAKYDAVSRFEVAYQDVAHRKESGYTKIFKAYYNPKKLIKGLQASTNDEIKQDFSKAPHRCFMVFRDEEEKEIKLAEVPPELADLYD